MRFVHLLLLLIPVNLCAAKTSPPNFLLIYVDDLGWADTSVPMMDGEPDSKSDFYRTPHLEKLAARGMRFSNGYAPAPTCTPSRKSIQFGKTPGRLKYTFVHDVLAMKRGLRWKDEVSMADVLKAAGKNYITAHFGKGMENERMETIGYDVTDEYDIGPNGNFHGEYLDIKSRKPIPDDDPKRIYSLTKRSVSFLEENAGKRPFFLMVSHYAVHVPHHASAKVIEEYRNLPRGKHCRDADYEDPAKMSKGMRTCAWRLQYAAMIDEIDTSMGKMIDVIEKAGQLNNTYIIYTSDNGGGLKPNGPLSHGKATLFEGGLRVPWVVAGPGVKAGVQCDEPVVQWDLLPTLHDLSGSKVPLPDDLDGGSLRSVFERGNKEKVKRPVEALVFHYPCYFAPPLSVIRMGDFKYMKHQLTGDVRLYNLQNDYAEKQDLSKSMPEKAAELDKALVRYLGEIKAEDVQDVYKARFEELDRYRAQAVATYVRKICDLDAGEDKEAIARLKQALETDKARFAKNREEVKANMKGTHWAGPPPKK